MFDFETDRIVAWISDGGYASVALQLPEGLKIRAAELSDELSARTGADITVIGLPCYGACDLFDYHGTAEALVHFGHSPIPSQGEDPNVLYIESRSDATLGDGIGDLLSDLPERIGVLATVQYLGLIPDVCRILESSGRKAVVGVGDRRICHPGQVLGCNCSAAEAVNDQVDAFLFIGEGDFHPLAAAFGMKKEVYVLNPVSSTLRNMSETRDRILRRRFAAITSARDARSFLVIECRKVGQNRASEARRVCELIRSKGLSAYRVVIDEVTPDSLAAYRVDAYVNTACPRIAMDDSARYGVPMLTIPELEIVLGERTWDGYEFDQIRP
jgi:2-(3-amino-3-carboxypropyl)histidine synthase